MAVGSFIREAQVTAELSHPAILPVHDIGVTANGEVFFVMKKVEGYSLGHYIECSTHEARDPEIGELNAVLTIIIRVGQALAYAPGPGVIHQDVKPDNIMIGRFGEVLLLDWGSVLIRPELTQPLELAGTPLSMAPEQARVNRVDSRSDIYALGATRFHCLVLRPPTWSDQEDVFWARKRRGVITLPTPDESTLVPLRIRAILERALAADPDQRYQHIIDLVQDLQRFQAGKPVTAYREPLWWIAWDWYRAHRHLVHFAALALTASIVLGAALGRRHRVPPL